MSDMSETTRFYRRLSLVGFLGLFVWVLLWHFALTQQQLTSTGFVVLLWVVPLLLPAKGIIQGKPYTHAWANFIVMFYFLHGLTAVYASPQEWLYALIELVFATAMFIGCSFYARHRGRELGLGLKKAKEAQQQS